MKPQDAPLTPISPTDESQEGSPLKSPETGGALKGAIFFDGLCILCSAEINHYRKQVGSQRFEFIDITAPGFSAAAHGVDPFAVHRVMHVKTPTGELLTGPQAFRGIWKELPKYQLLYRLTDNRIAQFLMQVGYSVFVKIRPYLPRRKDLCESSPYCDLK